MIIDGSFLQFLIFLTYLQAHLYWWAYFFCTFFI
nr:MAG TPA: hypothetical protein [Caudoviricetes sp.]DAV65123.1 MAG TPA: hypothetical protein [Caudoviricetes sp.]